MTKNQGSFVYRPDIDGLRAMAVLLVVLFHLNPAICPGGFAGVDIFFVISGFLISGIIFDLLRRDRFTFLDFYARRARRIFPALALVLIFTLVVGRFTLFANEFKSLGKHVISGTAFLSNFVLFGETGYFDTRAELKPLLHLWSLGIEEQFYFAWPAILVFAWRRKLVFPCIAAIAGISFFVNVLLVTKHPDAAFYLPLTRFWELLVGAMLAFSPSLVKRLRFHGWSWLPGVALLFVSAVFLNKNRAFPGLWGVLPTLGTALLIAAGPNAFFNRTVLSRHALVAIGLLSYPLYLWHWPLLYFVRILGHGQTEMRYQIAAIFGSFLLAWMTRRFVELPIRQGGTTRHQKQLAWATVCAMVLVGLLGGFAWIKGNPYNANRMLYYTHVIGPVVRNDCALAPGSQKLAEWCWSDRRETPRFVVWGDSHGQAFYLGLLAASRPGERWMLISRPSCPPVIGVKNLISSDTAVEKPCEEFNSATISALEKNKTTELVLLVFAHHCIFPMAFEPEQRGRILNGLVKTVRRLQGAGKQVAFLVDNPTITMDPELCPPRPIELSLSRRLPVCSIPRSTHEKTIQADLDLLRDLSKQAPSIFIFNPAEILCTRDSCPVVRNGQSLYSYSDHLSDLGSGAVAREFLEQLAARRLSWK